MNYQPLEIKQIGTIHTPFETLENMPIQPKGADGAIGRVELQAEYAPGLKDLDGFSHIYLIYHFHHAGDMKLIVKPFMDPQPRGVFSTRAPVRPNHIGLSIVELVSVEDNVITVKGIDVLDGTPLLDIKPYIEKFDHPENSRSGWMQASHDEISARRSDERFK